METRVGQHLTRVRGSCAIKTVLPRVPGDGRRSKGELTHLLDMPPQAWPLCILTSRPQWWPGPPSGYAHLHPHICGHAPVMALAPPPGSSSLSPVHRLRAAGLTPPRHSRDHGDFWGGGGGGGRRSCQLGYYCPDLGGHLSGTPTQGKWDSLAALFPPLSYLSWKEDSVCVWRHVRVCVCVRARNFTNSVEACLHEVHSVTSDHMDYVRVILWLEYRAWAPEECLCVVCRKRSWWHKGRQGGDWWETALEKILKRWKQGFRWWDSD